ncbi:putative sulfate exporter family transporter [Actinotalea sp. BY-33]|uniref:Sulfate exporter family transporter n=1 Tax=Actinotalea soli TaxID=2819234 RepID=A0A939LPB1_9CELL|nr:putative sulfate exporter family transporter [Actinotalea soli]
MVLAAAASLLVAAPFPAVSALLVAIVLGVVLRNARLLPAVGVPGVVWWSKKLLRTGIVLLGLQLSIPAVLALGVGGVLVVVVTVAVTFAATLLLGRLLRVPGPMTLLIATGFSICGAAAVAAMSAVVDPDGEREEDTATAIALVTLFGTVTLVALPLLVPVLGMDDRAAGLWIGASVHEVAQVVAAGGLVSSVALSAATLTKLGRVVLLAPLVAGVGVARRRTGVGSRGNGEVGEGAATGRPARSRPPLVPLFVAGFLVMVAVRSTGWVPAGVLDVAQLVTTALLTAAMVGLGTGVDVARLVRTGGRAAVLGAGSTLVAAGVAGGLVLAVS